MNRATTIMIVILFLCAFTTQGIPISGSQGRCQCLQTTSNPINPRHIMSLKYIPKGSHCETLEIIVTMKNGNRFCVSPDAGWMKIIIKATKGARLHN
ncbi:interleukin-8-like [Carcharodon carcharias]|uniref:interleukin-8-like n=1 Tax=Carcharodon carcharias TaxID=13397 RepID=UPI001B7ECB45|nr:interleukin-8-like [Carcharodon carcharias]